MRPLSFREREVRDLVARGFSNAEIAERLFVTEKTIKFHITTIYKIEGVSSRAQLIVKCLRDPLRVSAEEASAIKELLK